MGFETITSLAAYTRQTQMLNKWQQRKSSGSFSPKQTKTRDSAKRISESSNKAKTQHQKKAAQDRLILEQFREQQESRDLEMEAIMAKAQAGRKLSSEELDYIKEKNPMLYQQLQEEDQDRKSYKRELENAKSKEEAQRVEQNHAAASLVKVRAIANNPNIPEGQKIGFFESENRKAKARAEIRKKFMESPEYRELPEKENPPQTQQDVIDTQKRESRDVIETQKREFQDAGEEKRSEPESKEAEPSSSMPQRFAKTPLNNDSSDERKALREKTRRKFTSIGSDQV